MAYIVEEFLKLKLPQPNNKEKEDTEDKYYNDLANLLERSPTPPWILKRKF